MRYFSLFFALVLLFGCQTKQTRNQKNFTKDSINPIIGNRSFEQKFQRQPNKSDSELERIQAHLFYVEKLLRKNTAKINNPNLQRKRKHFLDLLHQYAETGNFPKNEEYQNRRPCFIDSDGNYCAVGYLVKESTGEEAAHLINERHQYDYIYDMDIELLDKWIADAGFSKKEIAMIQPTYNHYNPIQYLGASSNANIRNGQGLTWGVGIHWTKNNGFGQLKRISLLYQALHGGHGFELAYMKTYRRFQKIPDFIYGIAPQYYSFGSNFYGFNIVPKIGISSRIKSRRWYILTANTYYQYDIPVTGDYYPINRHSVNVGLQLHYAFKR